MSELLKEEKHTIKLDDMEYEIAVINLNTLAAIDDEFGGFGELVNQFKTKQAKTLLSLIWIMLKDKNPDLTKEVIGTKVKTFKEIKTISDKLLGILKDSME